MMKQLPAAAISSNSIIVLQHSSSSSLVFSSRTPVRASFRKPVVVRISSRGTGKTNGFRFHYPRRKWLFTAKSAEPDDAQPEGGDDSSSSAANSFLSVLCPLLRLFSGGDPSGRRNHALELSCGVMGCDIFPVHLSETSLGIKIGHWKSDQGNNC